MSGEVSRFFRTGRILNGRIHRASPVVMEAAAVNAVYDIPTSGPSASYAPLVLNDANPNSWKPVSEWNVGTLQTWNKTSRAAKNLGAKTSGKRKSGRWRSFGKQLVDGLKQSALDALEGPRNIGGTMDPNVPYNVPTVPPVYNDGGTPPNRRTAFPDADISGSIEGDGWGVQFGDAAREPFPWWLILAVLLIIILLASRK